MRILFIIDDTGMYERLGVMSLSAVLKKEGHRVRLIVAKRCGLKKIRRLMVDYSPAIVGYSAMTGDHLNLMALNLILKKEFRFISVFGGPHATFFSQLIHEEGVDAVCVGEGDLALPEFCRSVEQKEDYWRTPNFIIKHEGNVVRNRLSPRTNNLDELPFPDRDLMYEADPNLLDSEKKCFLSTRGCPYHCSYCFNSKYNELYRGLGPILSHRSPLNLINEICEVRNRYPLRFVIMLDDTFLLKPEGWFKQFSKLYKERAGIPFGCNIRSNLVTEEIIGLLREAGLCSVYMGVECGDEEVANNIIKRDIRNEQILRAARIVKEAGVKLTTENLCGLPVNNSYQVDIKTLKLNISINPTFAWSSVLYPYPGTPIETYARGNNFLKGKPQHLQTNKYKSMLTFDSSLEKRQIENLHKLFGLLVRFPWLRPWGSLLCKLPLTKFYLVLYYLWYGYQMEFKLYPRRHPWNYSGKRLWSYIRLLLRFIR